MQKLYEKQIQRETFGDKDERKNYFDMMLVFNQSKSNYCIGLFASSGTKTLVPESFSP